MQYRKDKKDLPFLGESIHVTGTKQTVETTYSSSSDFQQKRTVYIEKDGHFCCDQCEFTSNFKHSLRKHLWRVHQQEECKPLNRLPRYTKVNGQYQCEECQFTSTASSNLKRHIDTLHRKQRFRCGLCGKTYHSRYLLNGHIKAFHENTKLLCHICSKQFNTRRAMNSHQRSVHEQGSKSRFECKECNKYFMDPRHFEGHMNMHAGKKTHMCEICGRKFHYYCSLTKHRESCTGLVQKREPEIIVCDVCGAEFTRRSSLNEHKKGKHGLEFFDRTCPCGAEFKWRNSLRRHRQICEIARHLNTEQE